MAAKEEAKAKAMAAKNEAKANAMAAKKEAAAAKTAKTEAEAQANAQREADKKQASEARQAAEAAKRESAAKAKAEEAAQKEAAAQARREVRAKTPQLSVKRPPLAKHPPSAATPLEAKKRPPAAKPPPSPKRPPAVKPAPSVTPPLFAKRDVTNLIEPRVDAKTTLSVDTDVAAIEERLRQRLAELRWRGGRAYLCRQAIAWSVALALTLLALFTSLVYGLKFGEATMSTCMVAWALAYSWTLAVVQPIQVVVLVLAPGLFRDDTRCGRCMLRLREMGGELFAD